MERGCCKDKVELGFMVVIMNLSKYVDIYFIKVFLKLGLMLRK